MESAARGRVRASSAMFNPAVTFQLIIGVRFLIVPSKSVVFSVSGLVLFFFLFMTANPLRCVTHEFSDLGLCRGSSLSYPPPSIAITIPATPPLLTSQREIIVRLASLLLILRLSLGQSPS